LKLQTHISLKPENHQIDYNSNILLMGSCFAENIGKKLDYYKFQNLLNPFGIIFHPVAIEKLVTRAINEDFFTDRDIFFYNEQWHCFEVHSLLSISEKDDFLKKLNEQLLHLKDYLFRASHIVFTYGTAWVYRFIESDSIVANCHKIPQKKFLKELLSVEDVFASIENTLTLIREINPQVKFIQTVSPVRHLKDGFIENTRSKAHLIAGLHDAIDSKNEIHYFPSYEIMMDELRDYRFYEEDLIHPNKTAVSIIWEYFKTVWIASETISLQAEIEGIQTALQHRPFRPESETHKQFLTNLQLRIAKVQEKYSHIIF